jgi:hypothetical protein
MPIPLLSAALAVLLVSCCATADTVDTSSPKPEPIFHDVRVLGMLPAHDYIELILAFGERAGLAVGDRVYMRCFDEELRITRVFEFRSRTIIKRSDKTPQIGPVRVFLHGAEPKPWCPAPDPRPNPP